MALVIAQIEEENPVVSERELTKLVDFVVEGDGETGVIEDDRIDLYDDLNKLTVSVSGTSGSSGTSGTQGTSGTSTTPTTTTVSSSNTQPKKETAKDKGKTSPKSAPPNVQLSAADLSEINKKPLSGDLKKLIEKANAIPSVPTYVKQALPLIVNSPYDINTPGKLAHFFGQIHTECSWNPRSEGVGYSSKALLKTFPSRIKDPNEANSLGNGGSGPRPNQVGGWPDIVYGSRKNNPRGGNIYKSLDGYNFRGHGLIQLTFKTPYYEKLNALYPNEGFLKDTEKLNEPKWALISALLWWVNHTKSVYRNDVNDASIRAVSKSVNGKDPANHLDARIKRTNDYYNQLK